MTNPRKEFLSALFRILEERDVPYCVSRNYQNLYEDLDSDVDLVVESELVEKVAACLTEAAAATGHRLVLRTRYVNFSYVFWHPAGGFLRMDVETDTRWRIFPILTAQKIIGSRRKEREFYIPDPCHESVVLFAAATWRGKLSERNRGQLASLYQQSDAEELRQTFLGAFGRAGNDLALVQASIAHEFPADEIWSRVRKSLIKKTLGDASDFGTACCYLSSDIARLCGRLKHPPGIALVFASIAQPRRSLGGFLEQIKFLYPTEKVFQHATELMPGERGMGRLSLRLQARRWYTLFKGGLFLSSYQVAQPGELRKVIRAQTRYPYSSRTFFCVEDSKGQTFLGNLRTGFMAEHSSPDRSPVSQDRIIEFISAVFERCEAAFALAPQKRGGLVVFVGLDGSGKTTVARGLCCLALDQGCFRGIRYYHFQPRSRGPGEFPFPEPNNVPRKLPLSPNPLRSLVSAVRLLKNVVLANLAFLLKVLPLIRGGSLVVVDRYYYNYFLDPVSVKYYGPRWWLDLLSKFFPRPELVVVFKAPASILLERKQELSAEEISRQSVLLERLRFNAKNVLEIDATQPPFTSARKILDRAAEIMI